MIEQIADGVAGDGNFRTGDSFEQEGKEQERKMSEIDNLLRRIETEKRSFDQPVWPPALPADIERLRTYARESLQTDLPRGYIAFLRSHDGLDFNGYVVYGATEHQAPFLDGFAEANTRLADPPAKYVFYGNTGHELFAQDRDCGTWVRLDNPSLDVMEEFASFEAMLERVLRDAYEE
jgi:hypothetical protein